MAKKAIYFILEELVCKHVSDKYGQTAWQFLDPRLITTLDWIRKEIGKPIEINTYSWGGGDTQSGLRCNLCNLVKSKTDKDIVYMSGHCEGQAADFSVEGMTAEEVREWLKQHESRLPYPIRLEAGVSWVHLDCREVSGIRIYIFNP